MVATLYIYLIETLPKFSEKTSKILDFIYDISKNKALPSRYFKEFLKYPQGIS